MSKTRFVAFATQKGGIGKSTITALVANYFHNVKGYNVAVIDCDHNTTLQTCETRNWNSSKAATISRRKPVSISKSWARSPSA